MLSLICFLLNLVSLTTSEWYSLTPSTDTSDNPWVRDAIRFFPSETCLSITGSCVLLSKGPVAGRFGYLPRPDSRACLVDYQASAEFAAAIDGGSAVNTLLILSMACSALLLMCSCLDARCGSAQMPSGFSGKRLAIALGFLGFVFNLIGSIIGWVTLGSFVRWLSTQIINTDNNKYSWPYTCRAEAGSWLTGVAMAGNLIVVYLAVQASYASPPQAQQLVESSSDQEPGGAVAGAGATAVSLP